MSDDKDIEILRLRHRAEVAESSLAAVKAENERLRKALEKIATSDQYVNKSEVAKEALREDK